MPLWIYQRSRATATTNPAPPTSRAVADDPPKRTAPIAQDRADENRVQDRDDGGRAREHLSVPDPPAAAGRHSHGHSDARKVVVSAHHEVALEVGREL